MQLSHLDSLSRGPAPSSPLSFCQSFPHFFLHPAESGVFSKVRVCAAERSNESPSGAFKRQNGLRQQMEVLRPDKFADVYTSALLATMVLVLRSSQPVSDTDDQAYTSSGSLPVLPTWAAVERVYSLDAEM